MDAPDDTNIKFTGTNLTEEEQKAFINKHNGNRLNPFLIEIIEFVESICGNYKIIVFAENDHNNASRELMAFWCKDIVLPAQIRRNQAKYADD